MSRITLAYEWNGHKPDSTVEVDGATAKRLIRDGRARPAGEPAAEADRAHLPKPVYGTIMEGGVTDGR